MPDFVRSLINTFKTMKTSVKFILFFVLLMLSFSIKGNALNSAEASSSNCVCEISSFSSSNGVTTTFDGDISYNDKIQALSCSDVELGVKPVSETFSSFQRLRRSIEVSDFLKDVLQKLCLRENLLVLDKSKSHPSDKDSYYALLGCEYYIFALRRIII